MDDDDEENLLKKEPNLRQNPSNINELAQYLGTSLRNDQLQSILASVLALGIDYELLPERDRHFPNLFYPIGYLLADEAESCLRLMLESVQYDMSGLEWLSPAPVLSVNSSDRNRKLDMLLTTGVTVTSLSEDDFTRFKRYLIENDVLHGYTEDTIESPCHLVKLLFERGHLVTHNLRNVFDWLNDCDCSYPEQLRRYCDRYDMEAPSIRCWNSARRNSHVNWKKRCLFVLITVLIVLVVICIILSVVSISLLLIWYNKFSKENAINGTYTVGGNVPVRVGECFNLNFIDLVSIEAVNNASNNTMMYLVKEESISTEMVNRENKTVLHFNHVSENVIHPFNVPSYDSSQGILYTADNGGIANYAFYLINYNYTERASCALKFVVFDSESDFTIYTNQSQDPKDFPLNSFTSTPCFGSNGTHIFSFQLYKNAFFYFALSYVSNITFITSASGSISKYVLSDRSWNCTLITDGLPCLFQLQQTTSKAENERWCLFAESNQDSATGEVKLTVIPRTYKKYKPEFIILTAIFGFIAIMLLSVALYFAKCYKKTETQAK